MIVFDGDSCVAPGMHGLPDESSWPYLVAQAAGSPFLNMGKSESTAAKCLIRLHRAIDIRPQWYVLQIGQWSSTQETLPDFESHARRIIETVNLSSTSLVLVTPPVGLMPEKYPTHFYRDALLRLSQIYRVPCVDVFGAMAGVRDRVEAMLVKDGGLCHFNAAGARFVADLFNRPEYRGLCR